MENLLVAGAGQFDLGCVDNVKIRRAQGQDNIAVDALITEDVHLDGEDLCGGFGQFTSKFKGRHNVFFGDAGILDRDVFNAVPYGQEVEDIDNSDPRTPDAGFTETDFGVNRDFGHGRHLSKRKYNRPCLKVNGRRRD